MFIPQPKRLERLLNKDFNKGNSLTSERRRFHSSALLLELEILFKLAALAAGPAASAAMLEKYRNALRVNPVFLSDIICFLFLLLNLSYRQYGLVAKWLPSKDAFYTKV